MQDVLRTQGMVIYAIVWMEAAMGRPLCLLNTCAYDRRRKRSAAGCGHMEGGREPGYSTLTHIPAPPLRYRWENVIRRQDRELCRGWCDPLNRSQRWVVLLGQPPKLLAGCCTPSTEHLRQLLHRSHIDHAPCSSVEVSGELRRPQRPPLRSLSEQETLVGGSRPKPSEL